MEKYLPEWFNEKEFENFLSEGPLTRQAWTKGMQRWRRTRFMLRNMIGQTPMKYISRMMKNKHAIMARTAMQNARDIQSAQDREEAIQAKRNFIKQEQVNVDFSKLLAEKLFSGSQTAFSLGTKPSAGERARMKNPTGNAKKQAKLKKREQRKDARIHSMEQAEHEDNIELDIMNLDEARSSGKEKKANPIKKATKAVGKPTSGKKTVRTPDKAKKQDDEPQRETDEPKPDSAEKPKEDQTAPTELAKKGIVTKVVVAKTKSGQVKILSADSINPDYHTVIYPEKGQKPQKSQLKVYLDDPNFVATRISGIIFKNDERAKPKTRVTDKEKTGESTRQGIERRSQGQVDDPLSPFNIIPPDPQAMMRQGPDPKAAEAQNSIMLSQLVMDPELTERLGKMGFLSPDDIQTFNALIQQNPSIVRVGDESRQEMFALASQVNPMLAGKELVALSAMEKRGCIELSQTHIETNAEDNSAKADIFIVAKDDVDEVVEYLNGKNCGKISKDIRKKVFGFSYKKGYAPLASSQASETLATLMTVKNLVKEVNNGEFPPKIAIFLDKMVEDLKKIQELAKNMGGSEFGGAIDVNDPAFTITALKKMTQRDVADRDESLGLTDTGRNWMTAYNFNTQVQPIKENIQRNLEELMRNFLFRKAMVYAVAGGGGKYSDDSLGRADGIFMASRDGTPLDSIILPGTFTEVVENPVISEKFDELVSVTKGDFRAKTRSIKKTVGGERVTVGQQTTPAAMRMEKIPLRSIELQHYEHEKLDKLFEYTFQPPDITITTMSSDSEISSSGDENQLKSFSSFGGQTQPEEELINRDTVLEFLHFGDFIDSISFDPIDFEELGLKTKAMGNPVVNKVSVNGVDFEIPVINTGLDEELIINYDLANSYLIELVNEGLDCQTAAQILESHVLDLVTEKYKRDYKREYKIFHGKPEQRAKRSKRVLARRKMTKKYGKKAIRGKDIDHKNGNALDNSDSNLRVRSINKNRADNGHSKKGLSEGDWQNRLLGSWEWTNQMLNQTPGQKIIDKALKKVLIRNKGKSR